MNARESPINPDNFVTVNSWLEPGETLDLGSGPVDLYDHTVDVNPEYEPDTVHDLEETPLPFDDDSFANVVAVHVLEHLENDTDVLDEMKRIGTDRVVVIVPIGERPETDDHERELSKHEWIERFDPDITDMDSAGPYYDLACVWKL